MRRAVDSLQRSFGFLHLSLKGNLREDYGNWSALIKHGASQWCGNYATRDFGTGHGHSSSNGILQDRCSSKAMIQLEQDNQAVDRYPRSEVGPLRKRQIGENISAMDKRKFLLNMLFDLKDSKEAVYGALDAWVAWERNFPLVSLKRALVVLEKEEQWHRIVQVIKWMLSKGQGTTTGTFEQLIRALEKDHRAEEAHRVWVKKISHDLHSAPWNVCELMISIYYRNNMLDRLVKLFKGLEAFDRKPPRKSIIRKVADAYEMLGLLEEKSRVLEKYNYLFSESTEERPKKSRKGQRKNDKETGKEKHKGLEVSDNGSVDSGPSDIEDDSAA